MAGKGKRRFAMVLIEVLSAPGLSPAEKLVIAGLSYLIYERSRGRAMQGTLFGAGLSQAELASITALDLRTIRRCERRLIRAGWLSITGDLKGGPHAVRMYGFAQAVMADKLSATPGVADILSGPNNGGHFVRPPSDSPPGTTEKSTPSVRARGEPPRSIAEQSEGECETPSELERAKLGIVNAFYRRLGRDPISSLTRARGVKIVNSLLRDGFSLADISRAVNRAFQGNEPPRSFGIVAEVIEKRDRAVAEKKPTNLLSVSDESSVEAAAVAVRFSNQEENEIMNLRDGEKVLLGERVGFIRVHVKNRQAEPEQFVHFTNGGIMPVALIAKKLRRHEKEVATDERG